MSAPAFTPGPWVFAFDDEVGGAPVLVIETDQPIGDALRPICHVQPSYDLATDTFAIEPEDEANARVIAAAPELYEALSDILADDNPTVREMEIRLEAGRQALAKARGAQ